MIRNKHIASRTRRLFIPWTTFMGLMESGGTLASLGAGAAITQEALAAAELAGIQIGAAGDEIYHFMPIPWDLDRNHPIRARIWFTHSSTDADTPDWIVSLKYVGKQIAISDAASSADDTLTFAATAVSTTAAALEVLDWEESSSQKNIAETDFGIQICVECNGLGSASANEITFLGLELEYTLGGLSEGNRITTTDAPASSTSVDADADYYL